MLDSTLQSCLQLGHLRSESLLRPPHTAGAFCSYGATRHACMCVRAINGCKCASCSASRAVRTSFACVQAHHHCRTMLMHMHVHTANANWPAMLSIIALFPGQQQPPRLGDACCPQARAGGSLLSQRVHASTYSCKAGHVLRYAPTCRSLYPLRECHLPLHTSSCPPTPSALAHLRPQGALHPGDTRG